MSRCWACSPNLKPSGTKNERSEQRAETLSSGECQMLPMVRALMPNPAVLLIDEPSAGQHHGSSTERSTTSNKLDRPAPPC
ncbi:ATP-binding cassette domain-containing protein [Halocatena marina]|uniref:ATP-binding cassette domain-containing protein n=1 Tax=Halocatena marina TaxID=2934937 RepID=A0ABD5YP88_9EURY